MVCFFDWLFGSRQGEEDEKYFSRTVSFKIAAHDFGKFDGKPEHWYAFKNKMLQASVLFSIRQSQSRIKKATTESTIYLKVQPMMVQPPILSEDTKKREMGELLLGIL